MQSEKRQPSFWAAPELASAGYPVFPISPETKRPSVEGGFYAATTDHSQIAEWIGDGGRGAHFVAFATGLPSGVIVVDADSEEAAARMRGKYGPEHVKTRRGGHWYFLHPRKGKVTSHKIGESLDCKGDGGYVLTPPGGAKFWTNGIPDRSSLPVLPKEFMSPSSSEYPRSGRASKAGERIASGRRNQELTSMAGTMRRRGMSEAEILAALEVANRERCEPPLEDEEVRKIAASVARYEPEPVVNFSVNGRPAGSSASPKSSSNPTEPVGIADAPKIQVNNRHLRDITADTLEALEEANDPPEMFVRAGALVRVREDEHGTPQIQNMDLHHIKGRADRVADFVRVTERGGALVETRVNPPEVVMKDIMALPVWRFPALEAVVESPILRPDGSIFDTPGYDRKTRLYYRPVPGFESPEIPPEPSREEVRAALELVNEAVGEFPYSDEPSAANTLALLITALIRQAIAGPVPLGLIDAPQAGTGKSLMAEVIALIGTGRDAEMLGAAREDEEWRKQITSKLSAGGTMIVVDNVEGPLYAPSLARALTSRTWTDRVLGRSEMVTVSQRATWMATGNNIILRGDLPRRCYWIRLDAKTSRPWKREEFRHPDLLSWVASHRGELVGAILTIARAWFAAERPKAEGVPRLGSFEAWTETVGGILAFAGIEGFLGNLEELYDKADEGGAEWEAFLEEWWRQRAEDPITVKDLAKLIGDKKTLKDALPGDLSEALDKGEGSFTRRLGKAIAKRAGTRYGDDGLHITEAGTFQRAKLWSIRDSSDSCEFVSFMSLYNPSASKKVSNEYIQAGSKTAKSTSEGGEENSTNSQTHTEPEDDLPFEPDTRTAYERLTDSRREEIEDEWGAEY